MGANPERTLFRLTPAQDVLSFRYVLLPRSLRHGSGRTFRSPREKDSMTFGRTLLLFALTVGVLSAGVACLPDSLVLPLFCRLPAEIAAAWFGVPLDRATLTYSFGGNLFEISRNCAATGFFSAAFALLLLRRPKYCWLAYPISLAVNALRIIAASLLTHLLHGFRYERLAHMSLGALLFLSTLLLLWHLTERKTHGHDHTPQPLS